MELHPFLETDTVPNPGLWYVVPTSGNYPEMRVGHCCVCMSGSSERADDQASRNVYLIAGANPSGPFCDTYILNCNNFVWDTIEGPGLTSRYEHFAFVSGSLSDKLFVFGGADQSANMNDIQQFDVNTGIWTTVDVTGSQPSPRTHHTGAVVGDLLVIYSGGKCGADPIIDRSVYCFDVKLKKWSVLSVRGDSPKPRHGHVMAAVGNKVFIHGGMSGTSFYDDLHVLDLDKNLWSHVKKSGCNPTPRAAHGAVSCGQFVYVFGGMNRDFALDDLYKLDSATNIWSKIELQGPAPSCRLDFAMCVIEVTRSSSSDVTDLAALTDAQLKVTDMLDHEAKPGSASSRGSGQTESETADQSPVVNTDESDNALSSRQPDEQENTEEGGACVDTSNQTSKSEVSMTTRTYKMLMVHGGMDTDGEIFDDALVFLLE